MSVSYYVQNKVASVYPVEDILVVKREILFKNHPEWNGIISCTDDFVACLLDNHEYKDRSQMETDEKYKQIIPYFVYIYADSVFLMQRGIKGTEKRLSGKFTLGIGGHVRKSDVNEGANLVEWGMREFREEVSYQGNYKVMPVGIINDDTNPVGRVHMGLVYIIQGDSQKIAIKDELAWGELVSCKTIVDYYDRLEPWSQMIFDTILKDYK